MISFREFISESINDKGILKAVFVVGLPGAGKSYTVAKLGGALSPRVVNTDKAAEFLSKKLRKQITSDTWGEFKDSTHRITQKALGNYINGMLPLFIDGTSNDASNILHRMGILESLGYDVGIIHVKTPLEVAIARANRRAKETGRHVDEEFIRQVHDQNDKNVEFLKSKVSFFREINNSTDGLDDETLKKAFRKVQSFFTEPVRNPVGSRHLDIMRDKKLAYLSPEIIPTDVLNKKIEGWYRS